MASHGSAMSCRLRLMLPLLRTLLAAGATAARLLIASLRVLPLQLLLLLLLLVGGIRWLSLCATRRLRRHFGAGTGACLAQSLLLLLRLAAAAAAAGIGAAAATQLLLLLLIAAVDDHRHRWLLVGMHLL